VHVGWASGMRVRQVGVGVHLHSSSVQQHH
jgi:hypothetical protein